MKARNLDHLLKIADPVSFIENCYRELLERSITPLDLKNLVFLLNQGMNKHALIYCIIKSEEFNHRFEVENFSKFKKNYFTYKLSYPILKLFNCKNNFYKKLSSITQYYSLTDMPYFSDTYITHQALSLCNIAQLKNFCDTHPENSTVITNPKTLFNILTSFSDVDFSSLSNTFLFSMPSLPLSEGEIAIIWDKSWADFTESKHNSKYFRSPDSTGRIILYNNSSNYQRISIHLQISSIENNSELLFGINNLQKKCRLSPNPVTLDLSLYLKPFYNEIPFTYIGCGVHSKSHEINFLKFFLENITCSSHPIIHLSTSVIGEGYYPYLLNDSYIRSKLHKNGFFEVSAIKLLKSYQTLPLETTRYDYLSDSFNGNGYYCIQKEASPSEASEKPGVILYTAKRTGTFSRK